MTTKEFREKLAKYGYTYKKSVVANDTNNVAYVSELSERYLETYKISLPLEVFDLICEYARTPIDERAAEEKYYWELGGFGEYYETFHTSVFEYFNLKKDKSKKWRLSDKTPNDEYETRFTEKEFRKLKKELNITAEFEKEPIKEEKK